MQSFHESEEAWTNFYRSLYSDTMGKSVPIEKLEVPPPVLGRVKIIWKYMRSSLPEIYFEPKILRSRKLPSLLSQILRVSESNHLPLTHNKNYDWV